jgi:hypothetical protein
MRVKPLGWPDLHGFVGIEGEDEEHDEEQEEGF